jgi:hypothetical protein
LVLVAEVDDVALLISEPVLAAVVARSCGLKPKSLGDWCGCAQPLIFFGALVDAAVVPDADTPPLLAPPLPFAVVVVVEWAWWLAVLNGFVHPCEVVVELVLLVVVTPFLNGFVQPCDVVRKLPLLLDGDAEVPAVVRGPVDDDVGVGAAYVSPALLSPPTLPFVVVALVVEEPC